MQPQVKPQAIEAAKASGPYGPSFRDRLRQFKANFQLTWRQVLGLDQVPPGPTVVGPPPRPNTLELQDPADMRLQWRRLVDRNAQQLLSTDRDATNGPSPKVQR